jgi:hypothetical protein
MKTGAPARACKCVTVTLELVSAWLLKEHQSEAEAARLHRKLVHLASMYPLIHLFLCSISRFASSFKSPCSALAVPPSVCSDITWISEMIPLLPSELPLSSPDPLDIGWWGDASTSFGVGVVVGAFWGVWEWNPGFSVGPGKEHDIGWAEAVAIELGLRMALHHNLLSQLPSSTPVLVRSDNAGVVAVVNKGRSRSRTTNDVLKRTYHILALTGRHLAAEHVAGVLNVSGPLSRGDIAGFLQLFPAAQTRTSTPLPEQLSLKLHPFA